ncbi:MAG: MmgE/PrpD family protein [Mycobacteriaceae bacterium]
MGESQPAESTLAGQLSQFATDAFEGGVPSAVSASVRQRILDILGLCVGAHRLPTSTAALDYVKAQGGTGRAHVVGLPEPVSTAHAAFGNGVLAHSLDYDDTHLPSILHPSASVVPAALAAAEASNASGEDLIRAVAVGLEVTVRLGMAGYDRSLGNSTFFEHGQHATSICGAMGSGVAAALLLGADAAKVQHTLGITASMASGIIEANRTGGTVKRLHCGWAAQSGVTAAELVTHGFTGPPTVLEGRFGFFEAFLHGHFDPDEITRDLGVAWSIPDIFFKPYPANHFTHAIIDAGLALRARGVRPSDVIRATVAVPAAVIRTIGQPIEVKRTPETGYQAQFSAPYALTAGLFGGGGLGVGLDDFSDDLAQDPARRTLMSHVDVVPDDRLDAIFPAQFPAIVRVFTADGQEHLEEVLANRGGNKRPLSDAELALKFQDTAGPWLSPETVAEVQNQVLGLDELANVQSIMHQLRNLVPPAIRQ